jgi:V/A-type H+-transporting ATPase subunit E
MSKQEIIERILSDANAQAEAIVKAANVKAAELLSAAEDYAKRESAETEAECKAYQQDLFEKRAAAARLEGAKIALSEKRSLLDYVYAQALSRLKSLPKEDMLSLYAMLLEKYAETGDVVHFAQGFPYVAEVTDLPVFAAKGLSVSSVPANVDGGMLLVGVKADKDLSFSALIAQDKEAHLSSLAAEIF